jgi:tRNA uridine 5-carbamoylmethylation protein Kti12
MASDNLYSLDNQKKLRVINLYGGPGCGKSTTAAGIIHYLKSTDVKAEYVTEFAKDLTWDESFGVLQNGIYVLANQYHRLWRLQGKVDVVVTDSPLLLNMVYNTKHHDLTRQLFEEFDNDNYFIIRSKNYMKYGRTQTLEEAKALDEKAKGVLGSYPYEILDYSTAAAHIVKKYTPEVKE